MLSFFSFSLIFLFIKLLSLGKLASSAPVPSPFTFYELPTPLSGPCDTCTGQDGALWIQDQFVNIIARIDPATGEVDEYEIPYTLPPLSTDLLPQVDGRAALACAIRPGADGNIYASSGIRNQLVKINITSKAIDVITPPAYNPTGDSQPFNDMYTGPNGMYFSQTTGNVISYYEYDTGAFTNYPVPTPEGSPLGMIYASDNALWFAEFVGNKIGRLDPVTGSITEYPLPLSLSQPAVIRAETEGTYIWFTAFTGNGLGRLNIADPTDITAFTNPSPASLPAEDTVDSQGNIWFSTATQNTLNKFVPATGEFEHIVLPGTSPIVAPVSAPLYFDIGINYGPGDAIWFTENLTNRVGRYALS